MKPRTLIIIIVATLIVVAGGLYFLLSGSKNNTPTQTGQTGSLPTTGNQQFPTGSQGSAAGTTNTGAYSSSTQFGILTNEPTLDYFVDAQNRTFIIEPNGLIKTVVGGQMSALSSSTFTNIAHAAFSYDGKKAMVSFASGTTLQTQVFDTTSKSWMKLPTGMQSAVWSPASYQIAYLQPSGAGSETIYSVNTTSATAQPVAIGTIPAQDMSLQWPNKANLVIADKPSVFTAGSAWLFNIANQTLTPAIIEQNGLESKWSNTTSTSGLVFTSGAQNSGGELSLIDNKGNSKTVSIITLASKCGFSASTSTLSAYCAVPRDQQTFSIARLPDEYEQKIFFTNDDIYKINITDGTLSTIFNDQTQGFDATNLKVFNNTLFFVNRYDQKVYALSL